MIYPAPGALRPRCRLLSTELGVPNPLNSETISQWLWWEELHKGRPSSSVDCTELYWPIKVAPEKKVLGHFLLLDGSIWTETMLYDQGISLRRSGYPTCLYSEKNRPQAPWGPKKGHMAARRAVFRPPGQILARKSVFWYRTSDFVNGPFVTPYETVDLAHLE